MKKLSLFNKLVLLVNLLSSGLLLLSCLTPYVSVDKVPILSFFSLLVPLLVMANAVFVIYWLFFRKRLALISGITLIIGFALLGTFIHIDSGDNTKNPEDLSVLSFNTRYFNRHGWINDSLVASKIPEFIFAQDPDIICLQEFRRADEKRFHSYPHRFVTPWDRTGRTTQAIFSKYPIVGQGSLQFPNTGNNAIYADIVYKEDTVRVYNVHLQSFYVIPSKRLLSPEASERLIRRLASGFVMQEKQAALLREHMEQTTHPKIICVDLNNNQYSKVYRMIKGDMNDSFEEEGGIYGRTYNLKFLPLRIDFILADPELEIRSHQNFDVRLSDHFPLMASFRLQPYK